MLATAVIVISLIVQGLTLEHAELADLYDDGTISQPARQRLQRSLDLEAARLNDDLH